MYNNYELIFFILLREKILQLLLVKNKIITIIKCVNIKCTFL